MTQEMDISTIERMTTAFMLDVAGMSRRSVIRLMASDEADMESILSG